MEGAGKGRHDGKGAGQGKGRGMIVSDAHAHFHPDSKSLEGIFQTGKQKDWTGPALEEAGVETLNEKNQNMCRVLPTPWALKQVLDLRQHSLKASSCCRSGTLLLLHKCSQHRWNPEPTFTEGTHVTTPTPSAHPSQDKL